MKNPQKTVKKITEKMPFFDISQFEQLLWPNYLSYGHQSFHASSLGPNPSLPDKKNPPLKLPGLFFGPKMQKYGQKTEKIGFFAVKTFLIIPFVWNFASDSPKPFTSW